MEFQCLRNPGNKVKDVVITTVPWTDSSIPLMAPAALKSIVEKAGYTCLAVDLNVEVYNLTQTDTQSHDLIDFFFNGRCTSGVTSKLFDMFLSIAQQIISWNPKIVGLSLFSYVCQHSATWISYFLKKLDPNITVVIGGAGCMDTFTGPSEYAQNLIDRGLVDYHIRGDGENSLYEFLNGNKSYYGINSLNWKELSQDELRTLPQPNYNDYHFNLYEKKALPLVGSRGCVRACKFCDYIANWKKFQWRLADDIFSEMITQNKKYGIRFFKFQDSLTNGNMKEFNKLIKLLADHNNKNQQNNFKWSGYYIFREVNSNSVEHWNLIQQSGATSLAVGIENLNEHIREAIGKKFSNYAIDFHLSQAKKHNIRLQLLNIVGYVNEEQKDIDFIKEWLRTHTDYKDILHIQWGGTLGIFPNTYLAKNFNELGLIKVGNQPQSWENPKTWSTPKLRAQWAKELNELSKKLGYNVADNLDNHYLLEMLIDDKF